MKRLLVTSVILIFMLSSTILLSPLVETSYAASLPKTGIAVAKQTDSLTTGLIVGNDGALYVTWIPHVPEGGWNQPVGITPKGVFPPGAGVAMAKQTNDLLSAVSVGNNGALHVSWVVGTGKWQGPVPISPPNYAIPGSPIAMAKQTKDILSALTIDKNGALHVSWVVGTGKWNGPVAITPKNVVFPPGAPIGITPKISHNYDGETYTQRPSLHAFIQANDGSIYQSSVYGTGTWNDWASKSPARITDVYITQISPKGLFPPGAGVAAAEVGRGFQDAEKELPTSSVFALFINKDGQLSCEPCYGGPFRNQK